MKAYEAMKLSRENAGTIITACCLAVLDNLTTVEISSVLELIIAKLVHRLLDEDIDVDEDGKIVRVVVKEEAER